MRWFLLLLTTLALMAACSRNQANPDPFEGLETHVDLASMRHLAEVRDGGWVIDFGTPAQAKYTVGDWRSGWGGRGVDGDSTYANVGMRGRVYFGADRSEALVARVRLRPHGTKALTPYLNNAQLASIHLGSGEGFSEYDVALPAEHVRTGENYLLLTFGGTTPVDGEDVSVAVDSIVIGTPAELASAHRAPTYDTMAANVRLGESERPALALSRSSTIRYYVTVPSRGSLGVGVGVEGEGEAPFAIEVAADGRAPVEVLAGVATSTWADHLVDLSAFAGSTVRIDLRGNGAPRLARAPDDGARCRAEDARAGQERGGARHRHPSCGQAAAVQSGEPRRGAVGGSFRLRGGRIRAGSGP
jgi:hypothetical protein